MQNYISSMVLTKFTNIFKYQTLFNFNWKYLNILFAIYNLVIFAFESSLIFTLKIKNMWEKQLHIC